MFLFCVWYPTFVACINTEPESAHVMKIGEKNWQKSYFMWVSVEMSFFFTIQFHWSPLPQYTMFFFIVCVRLDLLRGERGIAPPVVSFYRIISIQSKYERRLEWQMIWQRKHTQTHQFNLRIWIRGDEKHQLLQLIWMIWIDYTFG